MAARTTKARKGSKTQARTPAAGRRKKASPKGAKKTSRAAPRSRKVEADQADVGGAPSIDWTPEVCETIRLLAGFRNTVEDIATILGVSKSALETAIADETNPAREAYRQGGAHFRQGLRMAQVTTALEGNAAMLRWLGVNELGQRDVKAIELTGADGSALQVEADLGGIVARKLTEFLRSKGQT